MRNGIKKICGLILMSALIWIAAAATAVTATSRSVADATPTALDTAVEASISDSGEEDWYSFTIPSDGYIYTTFSHGFIDNNKKYWKMWILNADGGEYYYSDNFIGNRVSPVESCRIGLPAGTYYLKIAGFRNNQWRQNSSDHSTDCS